MGSGFRTLSKVTETGPQTSTSRCSRARKTPFALDVPKASICFGGAAERETAKRKTRRFEIQRMSCASTSRCSDGLAGGRCDKVPDNASAAELRRTDRRNCAYPPMEWRFLDGRTCPLRGTDRRGCEEGVPIYRLTSEPTPRGERR